MPGETLDVILNILKKGTGGADAKKELDGVEKAAKAGGAALSSFDTSSKAVWRTLTSGARAAGMTSSEMGKLATQLGVASDAEVQATIKMNQLTAAWEKGEISSDDLAKGINELGGQAEDLSGSVDDASADIGDMSKVIDVAMVAAVAKGAIELAKMTYELAQVGAQSLRTKSAFEAISGGSRQATDNLDAMREATRGAMTETDMMAVASQMLQMGLVDSAEGLGEMTEMAVRLGSAMGMSAGPAMENWNLMIANQSIPRLDSYGISASKVRTRMGELQAATAGMSREQAFMIAVTEEGTASMERLGPATDDAALSFERAETTAENLKTAFSERLAPAIAATLDTMMLLVTWDDRVTEARNEHAESVLTASANYKEYADELMRTAGVTGMVINAQGDLVRTHEVSNSMAGGAVVVTEQLVQANFALSESVYDVARTTDTATIGWANAAAVMTGQTDAAQAAAQATRDLAAAEAEAAVQAAAQAKTTADLAQSLMDATSGQVASRLIGMLDPEKMGADAYGTAVGEIGLQFGIMDEKSIALSEHMGELAEAIESGVIPAEDADEALAALIEDAEDGEVGIHRLAGEFDAMADEAYALGGGLRNAGGGLAEIDRNADGAAAGIGQIGGEAELAWPAVEKFAGKLGTTEDMLSQMVANSPYTISVIATPSNIPEDVAPGGAGGLGRGSLRTDNRQYSQATTVTNYITDPMSAAMLLAEQRELTSRRIEKGF